MGNKKEITCIACPIGCSLHVEINGSEITVTGNRCKRGENYAFNEITNPRRTVTSNVKVVGGEFPLASVKTSDAIPKKMLFDLIESLREITLKAPVHIGDTVIKNFRDTGIDVLITREVGKK